MVFQRHHLVDAQLVASALELGVQEGVHDLAAQTRAHDAPAQAEGVGVVVAAGKLGAEGIAAAAGADALHLVGAHRHAYAGAAAQDDQCAAAALLPDYHRLSQAERERAEREKTEGKQNEV